MAETYGVYDWRALPLCTAATLASGLPTASRVMRAIGGIAVDTRTLLLAIIADRLGHIAWMFSEDGAKGANHPPSILETLIGKQQQPEGYDTGADFFAAWAAIVGGDENA